MPISEIEQAICKVVARRLVDHFDFTTRRVLLKEFKSAAPEALSTLVSSSILKTLGGNPEIYLPCTLTFEFCGDRELLGVARLSTQVVLQASRGLFERELERGDQRQYSPADIEKEVMALGLQGQRVKIGLGLYLAEEFGVFPSIQKNHPGLEIVSVQIGERILTMRDIERAWDRHIRQMAPNLYSESGGGLGKSIAAPIDHSTDSSTMQMKDAKAESRLEVSADPNSRVTSGITEGMATDITKRGIEAAVRALSDKPSLIDLLDYRDYAKALIDLIQNPKTQTPLTIAIDGACDNRGLKVCLIKMLYIAGEHASWFRGRKLDYSSESNLTITSQGIRQLYKWERNKDPMMWED